MTKNESLTRKTIFTVVLLGASCALLGSVFSAGRFRQGERKLNQSEKRIVIGDGPQSLRIVKSELTSNGRLIHIAVQNISGKSIDWFRLSMDVGSDVEVDFPFAENSSLPPGDIYEDDFPFDSKLNEITIRVVSVWFVDKSFDGDKHYAKLLSEKRAGQRVELDRIVSLLKSANQSLQSKGPSVLLESLSSEVSNSSTESRIPVGQSNPQTEARLIGVRSVRERVLAEIKRIQILADENSFELTRLEGRYKSIHSRLAGYDFENPAPVSSKER